MSLPDGIIARHRERDLLRSLYERPTAELVSVTGRRRVGKTFLIDKVFQGRLTFKVTGSQTGTRKSQLKIFRQEFARQTNQLASKIKFEDWQDAFFALEDYLETLPTDQKPVIFLDELPWLATHKSGFLHAFGHFWNTYASNRNMLVIICGSAASWMINKVVRHKGGLHNRITQRIQLEPFTLFETRQYLRAKHFQFTDYDIAELHMIMGGIPFYLDKLKTGIGLAPNIDQIAFDPLGMLNDEFSRLYPALFDHADRHISIVRALSKHFYGLDRQQIIKAAGLSNGGGVTKAIEELEFSGFIKGFYLFNKKKRYKRYRLMDEYSNFYLSFIAPNKGEGLNAWQNLRTTQRYVSWRGYAFENLGLRHVTQIKRALGISGVHTASSSYTHPGTATQAGVQIDLVIDRADRIINLCEFKFYNEEIAVSSTLREKLRTQQNAFRSFTQTKKTLFTTLISPYGIRANTNVGGVISSSISLEDLFGEG